MPSYFRIDVELLGMGPRIWRSILLRKTATFADLHHAIMTAARWRVDQNGKFHDEPKCEPFAAVIEEPDADRLFADAREVRVASRLRVGGNTLCFHSIGPFDPAENLTWHRVDLVAELEMKRRVRRSLLDGDLAYPPEPSWTRADYDWALAGISGIHPEGGAIAPNLRVEIMAEIGHWRPNAFDLKTERRCVDE